MLFLSGDDVTFGFWSCIRVKMSPHCLSTWTLRQRLSPYSNNTASSSLWCLICELRPMNPLSETCSSRQLLHFCYAFLLVSAHFPPDRWPVSNPSQTGMADAGQPDQHWSSNGQENGENGYSAYSSAYRENGYHGGAAAHPGGNTHCVWVWHRLVCG